MLTMAKIKQKLAILLLGLSLGSGLGAQEQTSPQTPASQETIEVAQAANPVVSNRNVAPVTVALGGNNAWDYVVFGNGPQIYEILGSIKGFLIPDSGDSGFRTLLLFVSIIGVVLLAVQAGFNPIFGFPKLIFFILAAGFISITTFQMRINLTINDPVRGYFQTVTGVPFIVGAPVSVISSVGMYFTRSVETQLTIPDSFKMVGAGQGSGGKFNLFADMVTEVNNYQFTSANLKQHISTYMLDCGIHGISRGKIGADELLNSANIMQTLGVVATEAVLTKKFEMTQGSNGPIYSTPMQELTTCKGSYDEMKKSAEAEATALFNASSKNLAGSGVNVLAETAMTDMLSALGANAGGIGGVSAISGRAIALQKGFADYTGRAFADAAQLTGNSELLMAVQVAQQEQAQKTSWAVGVKMFNNMMGYLFTVLQAFILALFPIMIVAFLIPGIGKKLMINMFQLLLWQALWLPGLAIVNYLIFVFSAQEISGIYAGAGTSGGFSINNSGLISEASANASLAAQFLGTLVPVITWGLVKGTLAFSEFIGGGIGQSLASSAGSSIAGGNLSQGQISQNQVSANKFNTATSFTSGTMDPTAYMAAGMMSSIGKGGQEERANGGTNTVNQSQEYSVGGRASISREQQEKIDMKASQAAQRTSQAVQSAADSLSGSHKDAFMSSVQSAAQLVEKHGGSFEKAQEEAKQIGQTAASANGKNTEFGLGASLSAAVDWMKSLTGADLKAQADMKASLVRQSRSEANAQESEKASEANKMSRGNERANSATETNGLDSSTSAETGASSKNESAASQSATQQWAREVGNSIGRSVQQSEEAAFVSKVSASIAKANWEVQGANGGNFSEQAAAANVVGDYSSFGARVDSESAALTTSHNAMGARADSNFSSIQSAARDSFNQFAGAAAAYQGTVAQGQATNELMAEAQRNVVTEGLAAGETKVIGMHAETNGNARAVIQSMNDDGVSAFSMVERGEDGNWKTEDGKPVTGIDGQFTTVGVGAGVIIGGKIAGELIK